MDFLALVQRIVYPRTDTLENAWKAAANSGYGAAIMALSHLLWTPRLLSLTDQIGPVLLQLAFGFVYVLLAVLAFRRSRVASIAILSLIVFEILVEFVFGLDLRFNHVILGVAFVLAVGGARGAIAIFGRHSKAS